MYSPRMRRQRSSSGCGCADIVNAPFRCRRWSPEAMNDRLLARCDLRGDSDCDLDVPGLGFLAKWEPNRQHAGPVLGVDLARVDRRR